MTAKREKGPVNRQQKSIVLALQCGGAHGAFAWGVLDRLLEDGRLAVEGVSTTSAGAMNAVVNEVSFNSSLTRELRPISFVSRLIKDGKIARDEMKQMLIHSIGSDETMTVLGVSNRLNADRDFLCFLHDKGRAEADAWLTVNYDAIGQRSSVDIHREFL